MIYQRFTYMNGVVYWITKEPSQHCTCILAFDLIILVFENSLSLFQSRSDTLGLYRDICLIHTVPFPYSKLAWPLGMRANDRLHLVMRGAQMLFYLIPSQSQLRLPESD